MRLKPRTTTLNTRALLYKRFIGLEKSMSITNVYKTSYNGNIRFWVFDADKKTMLELDKLSENAQNVIEIQSFSTILRYYGKYFVFKDTDWHETTDLSSENITLLNLTFGNIGKYQTNNYYYVGSFVYTHSGSITETTTQYLKGNIIPLSSMNIKTYNDFLDFKKDDLCVIDRHLFSIEEVEHEHKQMPKDFYIHYLTLNSIL